MTQQTQTDFDTLGFIMKYEAGDPLTDEAIIDGFQHLVDSGVVWQLQGSYGHIAHTLISSGLVHLQPKEKLN